MFSLWTILKTPIPGLKRRPRVKRAPWVLRHCPESKRGVAVLLFTFAGLFAHIILYLAAIIGIFLIPLFLTAQHPDAPVAVPMRWLHQHFSHDTVFFIYSVIWGAVVFGLTYATKVFDYICKHPKGSDDASDSVKSDVA
jgi:hypothetical protein